MVAARRTSKGRQKIPMRKIERADARMVCFSKRRSGLFKKAGELATLSGAEVGVVVFSPAGKPFSFGHPSVDAVARRFLAEEARDVPPAGSPAPVGPTLGVLQDKHEELCRRYDAETKKMEAVEAALRSCSGGRRREQEVKVEELELEQLLRVKKAMEELRMGAARRAEALRLPELSLAPGASAPLPAAAARDPPHGVPRLPSVFEV